MNIKQNGKRKPNILLITVDSLRADFTGVYNKEIHKKGITRNIDQFSDRGFVFQRAIAHGPHTALSFLAMFSGYYPSKFGDWFSTVSEKRPLLAEVLKNHGYGTYAFHSNPYISRHFRFDRGFDVFIDNLSRGQNGLEKIKFLLSEPYESIELIHSQVQMQMAKLKQPYFMWVHYMDVHGPYVSRTGFRLNNHLKANYLWKKALSKPERITHKEKNYLIACYQEKIAYLDSHINQLFEFVDVDNTLIIFTADHGDMLGEKGMFGHSRMLYDQVLHVPLIIKIPGYDEKRFIANTVGHIGILPSIIDILDIENEIPFPGNSFASLLKTSCATDFNGAVISEISRKHLCIEKNSWKLILDLKKNKKELFNLNDDPYEAEDVHAQHGKKVQELENLLKAHIRDNQSNDMPFNQNRSNKIIEERLKSLGYI